MAKRRRREDVVKRDDIGGFIKEFANETPRAAAILGATFLQQCLGELIGRFLIYDPTEVDKLLEGPLQHFAPRIRASYCMGLISEDEYHDLQIIRDIRNGFAHDLHGLSFSTAWVKDKCAKLQLPKKEPQWPADADAQDAFRISVAILSFQLGARTGRQERRVVPSPFQVGAVD